MLLETDFIVGQDDFTDLIISPTTYEPFYFFFHLATSEGGHGDDIIEIACGQKILNVPPGTEVEIALFPRN